MPDPQANGHPARWLPTESLGRLLDALRDRGYEVRGPVVRDGAVRFEPLRDAAELPWGWRDVQEPGRYRLEPNSARRAFGVVHGPESAKRSVFAPREELLRIEVRGEDGRFEAEPSFPERRPLALLGLRACDLAGLAMQDRIFLGDRFPDPWYATRREALFLIGVSCTRSVSTCFCTSMGTGPEVTGHCDLALTELDGGFLVRAHSDPGRELAGALPLGDPPASAEAEERGAIEACAASMQRSLPTEGLPERLYERLDHEQWDDVAERCLSCGNCTMVCPTCFCHDQRDEPALEAGSSVRVREWDSCFNREHAQIHGINFRPHVRQRYRQWLVHKLASWVDQFGASGCVGCGRCITWCPVGIDLTQEVALLTGEES